MDVDTFSLLAPLLIQSSAVCIRFTSLRPVKLNVAPSCANCTATAAPMPLLAPDNYFFKHRFLGLSLPVIMTTRSFSFDIYFLFWLQRYLFSQFLPALFANGISAVALLSIMGIHLPQTVLCIYYLITIIIISRELHMYLDYFPTNISSRINHPKNIPS